MTNEPIANILVVDDDPKTLLGMEALLAGPGRNIVTVDSGRTALRALLRQDFVLILLDVRMPEMDGFETATLIRQNKRFRYTPIIFLSAIDTLASDVSKGVTSGAVDYLFKPVVPEILRTKVGVFVDLFRMSERLKEQAVRQSEERFRLVIESLQDYAVFMMDPEGRVNMWNLGAERISGWQQEDVIGQNFMRHYVAGGHGNHDSARVLLRAASEGRYEEESWHVRKDGSKFWGNLIVTPVRDDDGKLIGFSSITRDLTERRRSEEEMQRLNAELAKRVEVQSEEIVRTIHEREKLQEQLLQAQKMESIGTLAGGIAHDFNNILNVISGYSSALLEHRDNAKKIEELVEIISESVKRGASVTQQLLAMARKTETSFEPVDINGLLTKLQALVRETFIRAIEVSCQTAATLPIVLADPNQINQVMLNLCVNARDAMPNGGKLLLATGMISGSSLRQRFQEARAPDYVWITVADTGFGMDETVRERVFEPFFTTKEPGQGTGLGLSVVYGIIRNHDGFVDVASQPGQGTIFYIYLPIPQDQARVGDLKRELENKEKVKSSGAGETILFVEDEIRQLKLMQSFLESEGFKVLAAKDGIEALEIHCRHKREIAVVVLDIGLPKLNGWETYQRMKKEDPRIKAIFATGYVTPEVESGIASGAICGLILKPYQLDDVLEKVSGAIRNPSRSETVVGA